MMRKKAVRAVCLVLAGLMLLSLAVPALLVYADDGETPGEKLERLRAEQAELEAQGRQLENSRDKAEQTRQYYLSLTNNLRAQLAALEEEIALQWQRIEQKSAEVAEKRESVAAQKALFEQRLKGMYEFSRQSNLGILLGVGDLSQLQRFGENLQQITEHDTSLVERLRTEQAELERQEAEYEQQLAELSAHEDELIETRTSYEAAIADAERQIGAADAQIAALAAEQEANREALEQAEREWREWVSRPQQVAFEYNGNGFSWPIPGYTRLSSDVGWRNLNGSSNNHRGMDIPAPLGTPIYAAADGVVSTNNHWSYGISVKLSHGSGLATIYGHMSARVVNDGDVVTQGQLIGYVGNTGHSYGEHLHFEANLNGAVVSPREYLGPPWNGQ